MLAASLAGCVAGPLPSALSRRPLTLPDAQHEIAFAPGVETTGSSDRSFTAAGIYRYGITDDLSFAPPFSFFYRALQAGPLSMSVGNVSGLGWGSGSDDPFSGDPRTPRLGSTGFIWALGPVATARLSLDSRLALVASASVEPLFFKTRLDEIGVGAQFAAIFGIQEDFSAALTVAYRLGPEEVDRRIPDRHRVRIGGAITPGGLFIPGFAYHLSDQLDFIVSPAIELPLQRRRTVVSATAGIGWHFQGRSEG